MGRAAGILKKIKRGIGFFTAKGLKGLGYTAKGIGKVANFVTEYHGVAKQGSYFVGDVVAPTIEKFAGKFGAGLGAIFGGGAGAGVGSSIGKGVGSAAGYVGKWVKDENEANKKYYETSTNIWDKVGDGLIYAGDWFEARDFKEKPTKKENTTVYNNPAPSLKPVNHHDISRKSTNGYK